MNKGAICILPIALLLTITGCKKNTSYPTTKNPDLQEQLVEANRALVKKDQQSIKGYIKRQGWNMKETETGLWYEILKEGSGDSVLEGSIIDIEYKVSLLDGRECYNSEKDGIKTFEVGHGNIESGIHQGVLLLKEGSKARFILAPHLAHGLTGDGVCIPARAIIIYEVEVLSPNKLAL